MTIIAFHPSTLLNYYSARLPLNAASVLARTAQPGQAPPWEAGNPSAPKFTDVTARGSAAYFDRFDRNLSSTSPAGGNGAGSLIEALMNKRLSNSSGNTPLDQDNQKLFSLYQALYRLDHIAGMANREGTIAGQLPGLDTSFQQGLSEVMSFVAGTAFGNLTLIAGSKSASVESSAGVPMPVFDHTGKDIVKQNELFQPVPGVSTSDRFTVTITKDGTATGVVMNLANVTGALTLDNINKYVNQRLAGAGFATQFTRVQTGGSVAEDTATWGIRVVKAANESVSLSSTQASRALYVAGTSGAAAGQQGKLIKLDDLNGTPDTVFSTDIAPDSGVAAARATVVDGEGNVYVVGNASGGFGNQINQASQDVFLSKHDSAGKLKWTRLLGSAGTAAGYALELDPAGGVVVAGSVTGKLTPASTGGGNDSFVAKYDKQGNQSWLRHAAPVADDKAMSLLVDTTGNVYVGGQVSGTIAAGQTSAGGADAYLTKLSNAGVVLYQRQFGSAGTDAVAAMAFGTDGRVIVASVQDGRATLTKFDGANGTSAALWQFDLGDLEGGAIADIAMNSNQIYVSGTTKNAALTAGGAANILSAHNGGTDAFVFNLRDRTGGAGTNTPVPDYINYVGTSGSEQGGGLAYSNGKLYLAGTTTGTFAGQSRSVQGTHNMFVTRVDNDGAIEWTRQYGGRDAQSKGLSVAVDANGSSVLDSLGLGRGELDNGQSGTVESQTTARAGDYFTMRIESPTSTRTAKITLSKGDTMRSLVAKINAYLFQDGKAMTMAGANGQQLKIEVNPGVRLQLTAGPKDFDALAGLGLEERLLINDSATAASSLPAGGEKSFIGLGVAGKLDLLSKANALHAHSALQGAMSLIKQGYGQLNGLGTSAQTSGGGSAYQQSRLANYQTALSWWSAAGGISA